MDSAIQGDPMRALEQTIQTSSTSAPRNRSPRSEPIISPMTPPPSSPEVSSPHSAVPPAPLTNSMKTKSPHRANSLRGFTFSRWARRDSSHRRASPRSGRSSTPGLQRRSITNERPPAPVSAIRGFGARGRWYALVGAALLPALLAPSRQGNHWGVRDRHLDGGQLWWLFQIGVP